MRAAWAAAAVVAAAGCGNTEVYYRHPDAGTLPVTTGAAGTGSPAGAAGTTGFAGTTGVAGTSGAAGTTGVAGTTGASGTGASGTTGAAGTGSPAGAAGTTGAAGTGLPSVEARLISDFEGGMATGWIADAVDGDWAVVADGAGKVYQQQKQSSSLSLAIGGKINWADQAVEVRVKWVSFSSTSALIDLAVRYQNEDAYYFIAFKADGSLKIRKRVDGSTDDIASYKSGMAVVKDTWYTLEFIAAGTTLTAKLNGMMVATGTDTALATGGIALGTQNAVAAFDDVRVTPP